MNKGSYFILIITLVTSTILPTGCNNSGNKKTESMKMEFAQGTYGYDADFFKKHNIGTINLRDSVTGASVLIVPAYQGRVMTSSSGGDDGKSYGWINYKHIASGQVNSRFNPVGGEERIWLGPEGGPFSIYFKKGDEQAFPNWKVPAEIDTEPFDIESVTPVSADFRKDFSLDNASGTSMDIGIRRKIRLLDKEETGQALGIIPGGSLSFVAYETINTLTNRGKNDWNNKSGFLSVWMLGMFNPSENGVVFIPFKQDGRKVITDDYFGKVPADRLIIKDDILFFSVDGKHRSKIGISPEGALPFAGSYDPENNSLTILWFSLPEKKMPYVNSKWGRQDDSLKGDAVNSYNDGPVEDGSIMGPFYEIESSSPAALLSPGESITHTQRTFHISGEEQLLNPITEKIFGITIEEIKTVFK